MKKLLFFAVALSAFLSFTVSVGAQEWYDEAWQYRVEVTIENPCSETLTDYQIQVLLDSSFDFARALPESDDLLVTDSGGVTPIPFWIEDWDYPTSASIWVKVPEIPGAGTTTIYLYYGNLDPPPVTEPDPVETPPIGPWIKAAGNPIIPVGDPGNDGRRLLAENMVYDEDSGHYWLVFADYSQGGIGLAWSDDPGDPGSWTYAVRPLTSGNAPHLIKHDGAWYLFYAQIPNIRVATASALTGTWTIDPTPVLTVTETWETYRVDEPYVFWCEYLDKWVLVYMGDERLAGLPWEKIGYATADNITGPYTKFASNPCIDFGPPGSVDAGGDDGATVADPWVVEFYGTYYIGYTVSQNTSSPWRTSYVTTTDWITFTKSNEIILDLGPSGAWDSNNAFRGAVTRFGDLYYFPYTGDGYQMGIATQDVWQTPPLPVGPEAVFPFFDDFNDDAFDTAKWLIDNGAATQIVESGGLLMLTASGTYIKIIGQTSFGMDYMVEARAQHPQAGTWQKISEVGLCGSGWANTVRMADDFHNTTYWERQAKDSDTVGDPFTEMSVVADPDWHIFRTYRLTPNIAGFQIDECPAETEVGDDVPTVNLPAFLMSYGSGNQFLVDWIRVRKYCGQDALIDLGAQEQYTIDVDIDVKPGSDTNSINLGSHGVIPVAILSSSTFDATQVDPDTISLGGAGVAVRGKGNKSMAHEEDVNGDGLIDLVVHVETEDLDASSFQDGSVILTGLTYGGTPIRGSDEITIVPESS